MANGRPDWTKRHDAILRDLHTQGLPLNQMAQGGKLAPFARSTIGRHAAKLGLSFDRALMEKAIEASRIDRKAERQRGLDLATQIHNLQLERVLAGMRGEGYKALINDMGKQVEEELDFIPSKDLKDEMAAIGSNTISIKNMETLDGNNGIEDAKTAMAAMMDFAVTVRTSQLHEDA